jgi:hypothetical protein
MACNTICQCQTYGMRIDIGAPRCLSDLGAHAICATRWMMVAMMSSKAVMTALAVALEIDLKRGPVIRHENCSPAANCDAPAQRYKHLPRTDRRLSSS